jgi:hypothetical protein
MKTGIYAALASALMMTSAVTAQEAASGKSYGLTLGPTLFVLPDIQSGVVTSGAGSFSPSAGGVGLGLNLGFSAGFGIGKVGDLDAVLGISGFASVGNSNTTVVDSFSGPGVVAIGGYTTPATANIALSTNSAPGNSAGKSVVTGINPQGGVGVSLVNLPTNPAGTQNAFDVNVTPGQNSFMLSAVATQQGAANTSAAYGAVAATDGGVFIGVGDLTGLTVTTNVARGVVYTGSDVTVALAGRNGDVSIQGYVGPSYRYLSQSITTTTSVDIPEVLPSATTFPTYRMTRGEQLTSHYVGGVLGLNLSKPISDTMTFSLGAEGGLYYTHDSLKGTESYSVEGGGPVPSVVPLRTVTNATGIDLHDNGLAWSARVSPSLTVALAPNRQLTFGAAVDYLSRVATVSRNGAVAVATSTYAGTDDGLLVYNAPSNTVNQLSFAPMWSLTPTISLTGQF